MEVERLMKVTDIVIRQHEELLRELESIDQSLTKNGMEYSEVKKDIALFEEVRVFLQELAEVTRNEIMAGLQQVVTLCLHSVFGEHLTFEIEVETLRNKTSVEFFVLNNSGEHTVRLRPEGNMGGGVIDTVAIGLRFGLLKILSPSPKGPIILDEPAKMVSGDRVDSIATLLQELTTMFDKQNILITHHTSLMDIVDHAVFLENVEGETKVSS